MANIQLIAQHIHICNRHWIVMPERKNRFNAKSGVFKGQLIWRRDANRSIIALSGASTNSCRKKPQAVAMNSWGPTIAGQLITLYCQAGSSMKRRRQWRPPPVRVQALQQYDEFMRDARHGQRHRAETFYGYAQRGRYARNKVPGCPPLPDRA